MPSLRQFRSAVAAAQLGSFTEAGRKVGLTQAAVGLQIRKLEAELEVQLFVRSNQGLHVTAEGEKILERLQALLDEYETLKAGEANRLRGTVHMGALVSSLMGAFGSALAHVREDYPHLDLRLFAGQSEAFARRVAKGELDAAIVVAPPHGVAKDLVWTPFYAEPLVLICPQSESGRTVEDLLHNERFLQFDSSLWTGRLVRFALEQLGIEPDIALELNSIEAIAQLVRQRYGVAIVPRLANAEWDEQQLATKPLPGRPIVRHVGMLERRHHNKKPVTQALNAWLSAYMNTQQDSGKPPGSME